MHDNIDLKIWISKIINKEIEQNLFDALSDGVLLCILVNCIKPNEIKIQKTYNVFQRMANISNFLIFAKNIGVPDEELFSSIDLAEKKNIKQVEICLYSFSRHAFNQKLIKNCVGPMLGEKKKYTFSDDVIFKGNTILPKQNAGSIDPDKKQKDVAYCTVQKR
ncbi:hypothetical protein BDAP_001967 [Binucleata daphniae]